MVSCPSSHPEAKARLCASLHSGGIGPLYTNIHDETRESGVLPSLALASCGAIRRAVRVHLGGNVTKGRTRSLKVAVAAYVLDETPSPFVIEPQGGNRSALLAD